MKITMRHVESQCQYDLEVNFCANLMTLVEIFACTFQCLEMHLSRCKSRVCGRISAQRLKHFGSSDARLNAGRPNAARRPNLPQGLGRLFASRPWNRKCRKPHKSLPSRSVIHGSANHE